MPQRQLGMVIDLNKCIGCQACTLACKTLWTDQEGMQHMYWNDVETKPGLGYPRDWEKLRGGFNKKRELQRGQLPDLSAYGIPWEYPYDELGTGKSSYLKPNVQPTWGPNWEEGQGAGKYPNSYYFYLPRICNHCSEPACAPSCPRQAVNKREKDGIVLIDQERCRSYRYCLRNCPYKKIFFNNFTKTSQKCIFCYPRVEKGVGPACARQCVGRIRHVSFLDDKEGPVYQLAKEWKVALPLHPEFGTKPNVFYVPPTSPPKISPEGRLLNEPRIPLSYLESLFGPEAGKALATLTVEIKKMRKGQRSDLLVILQGRTYKDRLHF